VEVFTVEEVAADLPDPTPPPARRAPTRYRPDGPVESIPPPVYVEALTGLVPDFTGKVCCPLHEDVTPSCHVYDDPARGWFCFGCGQGGTVYELAALLAGYRLPLRGPDFLAVQSVLDSHLVTKVTA
jgi:hypothetical protein